MGWGSVYGSLELYNLLSEHHSCSKRECAVQAPEIQIDQSLIAQHEKELQDAQTTDGKIDLIQAEAVNSLIKAQNKSIASLALNNISGSLSKTINSSVRSLMNIIKTMEHELDFNDDEISFTSKKENISQIEGVSASIQKILDSSFLLSGQEADMRVCFAGKTNAGKSSLFNALLGNKRSITSKTAGTTRDAVSEWLEINELRVQLVDTAGLRKKAGKIEKKGIFKIPFFFKLIS